MRIYVGNLSFRTDENGLRGLFEQYGSVSEVAIINDRETGRSRGFGFVTMPDDAQAREAIEATNGLDFEGRALSVNEAEERKDRGGGHRR